MPVSIPSDKTLGDLGHTADHNEIYATLRDIAEKKIRLIDAVGTPVDGAGDPVVDPANAVAIKFNGAPAYTLLPGHLFLVSTNPAAVGQLWVKGSPSVLDARQPESKDILIVSHDSGQTALQEGLVEVPLAGYTIMLGAVGGSEAPYTVLGPQPQGSNGFSAYEVAVEQGFVGTEADWLASLVGPEGPGGPEGPAGVTNVTVDADWVPGDPLPTGTTIGTRILRRKP